MFWDKFFMPKPFNQGYLPELEGHKVFFWEFGNPKGKPVLVTHGGPGYETQVKHAMDLDLKKFRVVMMDQRGCGKSVPFGEIKKNTTQDIIKDMKRLLDFLKIKRKVILKGTSWASTISLLFAQAYPEIVDKLVLAKIFIPDVEQRKYELEEVAKYYPDIMDEIKSEVKGEGELLSYYKDLINSSRAKDQYKAYSLYGSYEAQLGSLDPQIGNAELSDKSIAYSRIYINYSADNFYLKEGQIWKNIPKIKHIPTLIVHNRLDMVCPLSEAYKLHKEMPKSKLVIVPDKGHSSSLLSKTFKEEIRRFV